MWRVERSTASVWLLRFLLGSCYTEAMADATTTLPDPFMTCDPDRLGGTPCFTGTGVPVKTLFDHLAAGDRLDDFLTDFPDVSRDQAIAVLNASKAALFAAAIGREAYVASEDELAAIAEAEAQLARGERVPKAEVDAFWRRHGL